MNILSVKVRKVVLCSDPVFTLVKLLAILTLEKMNFEVERSLFLLDDLAKESWVVLVELSVV